MRKIAEKQIKGFTLSELLIALAILGVIATFTIPKVLQSQQNEQYAALAKEMASSVSAAYQGYSLNKGLSSNTDFNALTPYLNYVAADTTTVIDSYNTGGTVNCSTARCLKMHNGGMVAYGNNVSFGGTGTTNIIWFYFDPSAKADTVKSVCFILFYNGKLSTMQEINSSVQDSFMSYSPVANANPPWFSWD